MIELKRILLVEDNPDDVKLTMDALAEHNLANEVVVVKDGVEALDYLYRRGQFESTPEGNPVVILLDLNIAGTDSFEVLRKIKSDSNLKLIPVVVLASSREEQDITESYKLGVNSYVVKPVNFRDFASAVKELGIFWAVINEPPPGSVRKGL